MESLKSQAVKLQVKSEDYDSEFGEKSISQVKISNEKFSQKFYVVSNVHLLCVASDGYVCNEGNQFIPLSDFQKPSRSF